MGKLISDDYLRLNEKLHAAGRYGERGDKWTKKVLQLVDELVPRHILDYGCGKGALKRTLLLERALDVREYDPAIAGKNHRPEPADLVVCTDVLEHIEPECLDAVIADLKALSVKALFVVVSTRPAVKTLEDGRNAHLIVEPPAWWRPLLTEGMRVADWRDLPDEFAALLLSPA